MSDIGTPPEDNKSLYRMGMILIIVFLATNRTASYTRQMYDHVFVTMVMFHPPIGDICKVEM